jgi:cobalt-zinc-cadmium efflux system outer membrane protein
MAATWGSTEPGFEEVEGDLFATPEVPALEELTIRLPQAPGLARWETEMDLRRETIAFEKAGAVPDLVLSGGVRHKNASDSTGFVLAVSIPIPLFDRNTGAIRRAQYRASQVQDARLAAEVEARVALEAAYESARAARAESVALRDEAVPAAEAASRAAEEAYGYGKLGYLDVLESRESLTQVRSEYLEALVDHHTAMTEIERIVGSAVHTNYGDTEQSPLEEKNG